MTAPARIAPAAPAEQPHAAYLGIGVYRPRRVVPNSEIVDKIDSSDEWIKTRSGIESRNFADDDETILEMSVKAAERAIKAAGIDPALVDCVISATNTRLELGPSLAPQIAKALGRIGIPSFDITAGCSGFTTAAAVGTDLIRAGTAKYVVVVGVERLSDLIAEDDRTCAFIFADGAGAAVIGPSDEVGISQVSWGADGEYTGAIYQDKDFGTYFDEVHAYRDDTSGAVEAPVRPYLRMEGRKVFRWAATALLPACQEALKLAGLTSKDIDVFVPHQANLRITQVLIKALELREDCVVAEDIVTTGNTSAASIPLAVEELLRTGKAKPGQTALVMAFGSGLAYAGHVITLPPVYKED
ncbi:beta-ketoacyl-ACP synthase 3 [Tsukamurella paurometabola]|uniref:3-oxoacyl-(Acyl-carrier-protein) synthase III n=1 Tax=Tsukamurella paurometabola (strain ATCC 8368 / DSM 20162 / CCUG 35730 / CIP 100753 / JCM 10117 / KCTC 9821 / NBRC 16120 / NCIMB 702349 / NCTC 13040) TaxID=521096 RepID=D5UPP6_TSUPD|nr:beta-ketoacyl-ACP synthase 3 [Tsukamurella paurometabola]ADG78802.1 3-oxoacyl-(acyl-carrier-protein) synthase III [Tsukamurella paurometabola DSM 20162]SUP33192.1 3-oxoacyl-[acyl-carrier-protein] synthase 3 [Tsukamurella paurometabola]